MHLQIRRRKWGHVDVSWWQCGKAARHDWVTLLSKTYANAVSQNNIPSKCKEKKKDSPDSLTLCPSLHQFTLGYLQGLYKLADWEDQAFLAKVKGPPPQKHTKSSCHFEGGSWHMCYPFFSGVVLNAG